MALWNGRYLVLHAWHFLPQFFSPNFEHFTIVRCWWNCRCVFLSQFSIVHFCPKLVVAPDFRLRRQGALYFSPNFEHFTTVRCWWNSRYMSHIRLPFYCIIRSKILEFKNFLYRFSTWKTCQDIDKYLTSSHNFGTGLHILLAFRQHWFWVYITSSMFFRTVFWKILVCQIFCFSTSINLTSFQIVQTLAHDSTYF